MSASRDQEIAQRMQALRSEGTWTAAQLPRDFDRAKDWREHVRAHPIPAVLAAAALGFTVVPGRARSESAAVAASHRDDGVRGTSAANAPEAPSQPSGMGVLAKPLIAALGSWAGRVAMASATGALQRFASENLHSFPTSFTKHGPAPSQRRSETTEQRRVYTP